MTNRSETQKKGSAGPFFTFTSVQNCFFVHCGVAPKLLFNNAALLPDALASPSSPSVLRVETTSLSLSSSLPHFSAPSLPRVLVRDLGSYRAGRLPCLPLPCLYTPFDRQSPGLVCTPVASIHSLHTFHYCHSLSLSLPSTRLHWLIARHRSPRTLPGRHFR